MANSKLFYRSLFLACSSIFLINCGGSDSSGNESSPPPIQQYSVTVESNSGGTVSASQLTVNAGQQASFTIAPNAGFSLASATGCSGTLSGFNFTTAAVQANCTVKVSFNAIPIANAGANQTVETGNLVTLDGSASTDPEADALTYQWQVKSVPAGATVQLSSAQDVRPTFTPLIDGEYQFSLVVSDPYGSSDAASVLIQATTANLPPIADAGTNQAVATGSVVLLDGSNSRDPEGQSLTYAWVWITKPETSFAEFASSNTATTQFTADVAGEYVISLTVNDGELTSEAVQVRVQATTANVPPVANAGADQSVLVNTVVQLNGTNSSDADGDMLSYFWQFVSKPEDSTAEISNERAEIAEFTPDLAGNYVVRLTVDDGVDSHSDQMVVEVIAAKLTLEEKDFFTGYRALSFPYNSSGTMSINLVGSNTITVGEYRLTAIGQDYVITDLVARDDNNIVVPNFSGLFDGQIIAAGESVIFKLESPKTANRQANVVFSFSVEGTEKTFQVRRLLTSN